MKDLIAKAKAAPGKLNYGAGTITAQLMGYRFHKAAGLDIVYVPFKGTPETVNGLLTGSVQIDLRRQRHREPADRGRQGARARQARPPSRPPRWPNMPTLAEAAGLPEPRRHVGLARPRGAQGHAARRSSTSSSRRSRRSWPIPAMREKSERTGAFPMTSTPEEFGRFIREEADRWSQVLKETNIKYD